MSTFRQVWDGLVRKTPALGNPSIKVEITAEQFRRALEQAYDAGYVEGKAVAKGAAEWDRKKNPFGGMFGF